MTIDAPKASHVPSLRALFADAFGESEGFLDLFFSLAFSPSRARIAIEGDALIAALYWFDCEYRGKKTAYIYGVATAKAHRGRGVCRALMASTHEHLKNLGYSAAILVPAEPSLYDFYASLGYQTATSFCVLRPSPASAGAKLTEISVSQYASLRRKYLPMGGVTEKGALLDMLSKTAALYAGSDFILAARKDGESLIGIEMLGNAERAAEVLTALGCKGGFIRTAGKGQKFAMFLPLDAYTAPPEYFGIALDL